MINVSNDYKTNVYAPIREFVAKITFMLNGESTEYDDEWITYLDIVEEMDTLSDTLPSNQLTVTLDNTTGEFNFLNLANMQRIIASRPTIQVEMGLVISDTDTEWLPMGLFYLTDWKSDTGAMTVTLTANDNLLMLDNISFPATTVTNLYDLAVAIFQNAGITNYSIDSSLKKISCAGTTVAYNSRNLLQNIGIAAQCAVYQDRNGIMTIKPYETLEESNMYSTYPGLSGLYASSNTYSRVNNGDGMKYLSLDNMYEIPEITLEKSIYQLVVNIYTGTSYTSKTYINSATDGQNGISFTIDNPLITSTSLADKVASWYLNESNYNAVCKVDWRQNPCLECADVVLAEDGMGSEKQTRIYKQEFTYQGYLTGNTESRGGI
ncbi:hypothetical protein PU629_06475 [Pullulanibacillus sp. KACC 23026]|uniref:hypothetical protein n=1 Tax=Pullulanibacillus sp. KACC 23026 TaxID=3028315 RepID=UPI0023B01962|nr:hypothetical protein [Pullulanibacillus sp. KACC 23026]WEG14010.1 hypothetical protein PU629_06475 [Pullulanibacillus sp. KACC 23026]